MLRSAIISHVADAEAIRLSETSSTNELAVVALGHRLRSIDHPD
jgi:hypothetical protein